MHLQFLYGSNSAGGPNSKAATQCRAVAHSAVELVGECAHAQLYTCESGARKTIPSPPPCHLHLEKLETTAIQNRMRANELNLDPNQMETL